MPRITRRAFLQAASTAAAAPALAAHAQTASPPKASTARAYTFFNPQEAALIEALVARLIPNDALGPGALEAEVPYYIDRQLGGAWGAGERLYRAGPFAQGVPTQGYQLPYTPAELFRRALRGANAELQQRGVSFAKLAPQDQDAWIKGLSGEKRDFEGVPSNQFFESLLEVTIEGYFSDPAYGGNKDMASWEMIGFPGAYADYYDLVDQPDVQYRRKAMSLAENGRGQIHAHPPGPPAKPPSATAKKAS